MLGLSSLASYAFPIASPGTEGNFVLALGNNPVIATYEGNSAAYSNDLYLELDIGGNPGMDGIQSNDLFLFNNHTNLVGDIANVGTFTSGTELVFRMYVTNTGYNFFSGPGSRNPDGLAHARVQDNWLPSTTLVSFEDLFDVPEGVNGFNDLSFSFSNTKGSTKPSVPDSGTTVALLGMSLAGLGCLRRKLA